MAISAYRVNLSGLLAEAAEYQIYTFEGVIGDRIYLDGSDTDSSFENIFYSLIDPSGQAITGNIGATADSAVLTLTQTGTYQIFVRGDADTTGDYNLNLIRLSQAPVVTLGTTISDVLAPGVSSNAYRLSGLRGQRLQFDSLLAGTTATWSLVGPNGRALNVPTFNGTDFSVTLPSDGEYYLLFNGTNATASVSYSFQINDISDPAPASPTTFPFSQSGTLAASTVDFTFTAAAGKLIYFDSLDQDFDSVNVSILNPDGSTLVFGTNAGSDFTAFLQRSGTYTVRLNGTGDYNFRLLDLAANATPLTLGTAVTETVSPTSGARIFSFTGAVGQRLLYDGQDNDFDAVTAFLIGPSGDSLTLLNTNASNDSTAFTLSEAGTYYLVQQSNGTAATDFRFQLLGAPAADLTFDSVISGTLDPFEAEVFRFTGTAGQRLVFDSLITNFPSVNLNVLGPNNEFLTSGNIGSDLLITLARSGTHLLTINSSSATPVNYSFQLVTPTTTTTALGLGTPVAGTISELGEQDIYTFSGTAGQRLLYDATLNSSRTITATLRSPTGALVGSTIDSDFDGGLVTLTETGTYQLLIEGTVGAANSTGNYNFQLIDAGNAPILTLDADTIGTLTPGAESDVYRFTAAAGQRFAFDAITGSGADFTIFDPGNTSVLSGNIGFDYVFTAPEAGTYLLQIQGNQFNTTPVSYSFRLVTPPTTTTALSLGTPVAGTITELGEQDIYTFSGTAGQRLFYDATLNNARTITATLRSPSGAVVGSTIDSDFDGGLVTLTETGTYQLLIEGSVGSANSTGNYNFQLIDAGNAPTLTLDADTIGTLTPGAESDVYRFTAAAGQRFAFDAITGSGADFTIYYPGNTSVFSGTIGFDYVFTAPEAGTYLLQIAGNANNTSPVSYSFRLVTPTTTVTALSLGTPVAGTITELGEQDIYTFSGTAGQRLIYDATVNNGRAIFASLRSPSGAVVGTIDADFDGSLVTLTETGTYQLLIEGGVGSANSTGNYNFQLIDAGNAPLITLGSAVSGTLSPGNEADFYRINGSAGQRLSFDSLAAATGASWTLFDPANTVVAGSGVGAGTDFTAFLDGPGTYLLRIDGSSASTVNYSFNVLDITDPPPAAPTVFPFSRSGTVAGSPVDVTFTAAAGRLLFVDSLDPDFDGVFIQILDQGNANALIFNSNASSDSFGAFALPRSGDYTLRVTGTGDYNVRLLDVAATATALSLGATTSGPLAAAATQIFSFSGSAGQRLYFDALEEDSDSLSLLLLRPDGTVLLNQQGESDSFPTFSLSETGTHYLVLSNTAATAADVSFALRDVAAVAPLSFDTVTNGTLSPGLETDLYRFTGSAGQRLVFDSQTAGFPSAFWRLFGPTNQSLANPNIITDAELNLTADGTYVLAMDGASATSVNYSFSLITPDTTTVALTLGSVVNGTIAELGERDIYTFTGAVGQRLYYDALTNDFSQGFRVALIDPSGDNVFLNTQHYNDSSTPFTLTEAGTYQLLLESTTSFSLTTGSYSFQLLDVAAAAPLSFDTVTSGSLSPGQESDLYRFTGAAGQRLVFDSQTAGSPSANWKLFGPGNEQITSRGITSETDLTLTADGTYVLAIDGASAATVNYSFQLVTPSTTTTALSLNTPVSGTLAELGEQDVYTFTGTAGQRLFFDALTNDFSQAFRVALIDPTGDNVFINTQHYNDSSAPFTLTETGTYQLLLESTAAWSLTTGSYSFQLLDLAAAAPLTLDAVTNGTLSPGRETDLYRFTGTAGQRLYFDSLTSTSSSTLWRLYGPSNQEITNGNILNNSPTDLTLGADGTYILAIDGEAATPVNYSFNLTTPTTARTGTPNVTVADRSGTTNTPIPLNIAASFATSDGNDLRSILISGVPSGATLSAGTNNNNGTWTLTPAQLTGLTITVASAANFALTVTATSAETTGDTATTTASFSVIVNVATGITVTPTSGLVTTEAGGSASFSVVLDSQPTANVTVGISSSDTTEGTTNVSSLTFTTANWNVPQTVIITGVDDNSIDGTVAYSIVTAPATSADPGYNGFNAANVAVSNTDNDTAGVLLSATGGLFTSEGGGATGFNVRLLSQPTANVTLSIASSDTTEGTTNVSSLTFTPANWNQLQFVTITGVDDAVLDGSVAYSIVTGATSSSDANYNNLAVADVGVTNLDNDTASFSVSDVTVTEGNSGTSTAQFTVTLNNAVAGGASVSYATANGTATAGVDYVATNGTLNFTGSAGETQTVNVTINGDTTIEPDETFVLNLSAPTGGVTLADSQGLGTITTDDAAPLPVVTLAVSPASILENGASNLVYTFTRTGATTNPLTVNYAIGGSATNGSDYALIPASVTFAAGSATAIVTVDPTGDAVVEVDETVSLTLQTNAAYTIGTAGAVIGTISNDDSAGVTVSPTSGLSTDENGGTATFTVRLNSQPTADVSISLASSDIGEGIPNVSSLTFTPANWNVLQTVTVTGVDDSIVDYFPQPYTILTSAAVSADASYNGLAVADVSVNNGDNDIAPFSVSNVSILEGDGGTKVAVFSITLGLDHVLNPISVNYATANGTATAGVDYVATSGTLQFTTGTAGETRTVSVTINGDTAIESDETFFLNLSYPTDRTTGPASVSGTILNDDSPLPLITLEVAPASVLENGATNLVYTFTRTGATTNPLTVNYTIGGTATNGTDYGTIPASVTFAAGSATASVTVDPTADSLLEPDETVSLTLTSNAAYSIGTAGAVTGTISNDDTASFSISDVSIVEGNAGTRLAVFTVTLSNAVAGGASVSYATANGTATAGVDYLATSGTLNFTGTAGETQTVTVTVNGDTAVEFDESFFLNLSAPTGGVTLADAQGRGSITNDDVAPQPAGIPVLFFSAITAASGRELWLTDGTAAGTRQVIDAVPGTTGAFPSTVQLANGKLLFASDDATGDFELWTTDGTAAGTAQLVEINPGISNSTAIGPTFITPFDGGALFFADDGLSGNELWFTDGTAAGTRLLADIQPGATGSRATTNPARQLTVSGGKVFFTANTTAAGNELWVIESVAAGPRLVTEIVPGSGSGAISVLTPFNDGVFFYANDGVNGVEAWYSDGTAGGTLSLGNLSPLATARTTNPTVVGDRVFFAIETSNTPGVLGGELWVSNGTVANTTRLLSNVSWPINTVGAVNGKAVFIANDGVTGSELWVSDGTPSGTRQLKDIQPGGVNSNGALAAGPGILFNGELYFRGTTTAEGAELWKTDGTEAGTVLVADINPSTGGSNVDFIFSAVLNGRLYFRASTPGEGLELWSTDGTAAGTTRVADVNPGTAGSTPTNFSVQVVQPPVVSISLAPATAEEGEAFTLTASRSGAVLTQPTTVSYTITGPAANAGDITTPLTGTITILANQTTATLTIGTVEDAVVEVDEAFTVTITNPVNGSIGTASATATILNDDAAALPVITLAVSPASVTENGATNLVYTFTRTGATTNPLTVNYAINGSATNGSDYTLIPASVTFAAGAATATVTVDPTADTVLEPNETVSLTLTADPAYLIGTLGAVTGTITNDDAASFSINDVTITEGDAGTSTAIFTVTLSNAVAGGASVAFATANGTATAGSDYVGTSGTLNFAGTAGETQTVSVTISGDTVFEPNESFFLNLTSPTNGVSLLDGQGIGTITNDDPAPLPVVTLAVAPASVTENGATNLVYTFTRSGATTNPLTVNYAINGSATNGSDYTLIPASVTFAAGAATATVTVDPTADTVLEPNETVSLTLTADPAYLIGTLGAVTGTITNDDAASFSINDVTITEGDAGTSTAQFTVTLSNAVAGGASVNFATANGTATAGSDYVGTSGTLNFAGTAGETQTVSVTISGDTVFEPNESFFLNLTSPTNGVSLLDGQGIGTITNDDGRTITGTKNRDSLVGTASDDVITGLQGVDTIRGNSGADRFVYRSIVDAGDTIIDFNRAEGDKVDLIGALASVGYGGTTPISDGYIRFVARGSDTMLQIDPDGSGLAAARNFILFKNVPLATLSNPDNFIPLAPAVV